MSFNGGKDCTVLLDLLVRSLPAPPRGPWQVCYVAPTRTFAKVEDFIADCCKRYPIELHRYEEDMKTAFGNFLHHLPHIKAILVGVRRTDPFCAALSPFNSTDNGWPTFMRVHPILEWTHEDIWAYLLQYSVPYCQLYDQGYTSLGDSRYTTPNPHLRLPNGTYLPAYCLRDGRHERAGRIPPANLSGSAMVQERDPDKLFKRLS